MGYLKSYRNIDTPCSLGKIHPSGHHPEIFILALEEMAIGTGKHYKTFSSL
jgi:hypothetical protein